MILALHYPEHRYAAEQPPDDYVKLTFTPRPIFELLIVGDARIGIHHLLNSRDGLFERQPFRRFRRGRRLRGLIAHYHLQLRGWRKRLPVLSFEREADQADARGEFGGAQGAGRGRPAF
jgi:hypothetical protein